jgi:hypothetical protein
VSDPANPIDFSRSAERERQLGISPEWLAHHKKGVEEQRDAGKEHRVVSTPSPSDDSIPGPTEQALTAVTDAADVVDAAQEALWAAAEPERCHCHGTAIRRERQGDRHRRQAFRHRHRQRCPRQRTRMTSTTAGTR